MSDGEEMSDEASHFKPTETEIKIQLKENATEIDHTQTEDKS
jgi:hypothetical protein